MTVTAFVPARSGSKRLPNKNVRELAGKPLVLWTLEACMHSEHIDEVIFSTDSNEYWVLAKNHFNSSKLVLDDRTQEEAGDKVKIFDYLKSSTDKIFGNRRGQFLMALPTMPLRATDHVNEAIELSKKFGKGVFSAVEYDFAISFAFTAEGEAEWKPVFDESPMLTGNTRSQDQIKAYHPNGAIYLRDIEDLRSAELKTIYQGCAPFIMDKSLSVDIDTIEDFKLAEALLA
jgi:CMP-N,N'-diacetyllegionaminic acid synthase